MSVEIDGVNNIIKADTISEVTSANGVAIDGLTIKDGGISATTGSIVFNEASADVDFRVESSGNANMLFVDGGANKVGIGNGAPANTLDISDNAATDKTLRLGQSSGTGNANATIAISSGGTGNAMLRFDYEGSNTDRARIGVTTSGQALQFFTAGNNERMRITSSGQVSLGTSSPVSSSRLFFYASASTPYGLITQNDATSGSMYAAQFLQNDGSTELGSIKISNTATAFNTSSDYRLKENVDYTWDATTRLKQLKPARFNFIADADTTVDGFLAHEVSSIVPEAISGDKDATETKTKVVVNSNGFVINQDVEEADWIAGKVADEDGNTQYPTDSTWAASKVVPKYQGIDQSKLVPLLVKTIQELEARITTLEG